MSGTMYWNNLPSFKKAKVTGDKIKLTLQGPTDLYRKHRDGSFQNEDSPYYFRKVAGDFTVICKVKPEMNQLHDQAGIYVRESKKSYVTFGLEANVAPYLETDRMTLFNNVTVTHQQMEVFRDSSSTKIADETFGEASYWIEMKRRGRLLFCSSGESQDELKLNRVVPFSEEEKLSVGVYAAAPAGDGFKIVFDKFKLEENPTGQDVSIYETRPKTNFVGESDGVVIGRGKKETMEEEEELPPAPAAVPPPAVTDDDDEEEEEDNKSISSAGSAGSVSSKSSAAKSASGSEGGDDKSVEKPDSGSESGGDKSDKEDSGSESGGDKSDKEEKEDGAPAEEETPKEDESPSPSPSPEPEQTEAPDDDAKKDTDVVDADLDLSVSSVESKDVSSVNLSDVPSSGKSAGSSSQKGTTPPAEEDEANKETNADDDNFDDKSISSKSSSSSSSSSSSNSSAGKD